MDGSASKGVIRYCGCYPFGMPWRFYDLGDKRCIHHRNRQRHRGRRTGRLKVI